MENEVYSDNFYFYLFCLNYYYKIFKELLLLNRRYKFIYREYGPEKPTFQLIGNVLNN